MELNGHNTDEVITWLFEPNSIAPLAKLQSQQRQSIVCDHLGTPLEMHDAAGGLSWAVELDSYGAVRKQRGEAGACPFRYQGQYEDAETGLYYNRFRYYDPQAGQYISQDPIRLRGGEALYNYVSDPTHEIDVLGLTTCHGTTPQGDLTHYSGNGKPYTTGATPNSVYTHIDPKTGKAVQNAVYDANGDVIGHVDFKNHGIESGHWHEFPQPGNPASGHGAGKPHHPYNTVPSGWNTLPPSIPPHTPIGT